MVNKAWRWFLTTSMIVGVPVTVGLLLTGIERTFHTLTCETVRFNCSRSLVHGLSYVVERVDATHDVTLTPTPTKRGK